MLERQASGPDRARIEALRAETLSMADLARTLGTRDQADPGAGAAALSVAACPAAGDLAVDEEALARRQQLAGRATPASWPSGTLPS